MRFPQHSSAVTFRIFLVSGISKKEGEEKKEILKFRATIPYPLSVASGFVVAASELFREDVLKMDVAIPGIGYVFRQRGQEPWQSTWDVQWRFLLVKMQTELQLAFVMKMALLWMRAEAVQEHMMLRRYLFG